MVRRYAVGFAAVGYRAVRQGENELSDRTRALERIVSSRWRAPNKKLTVFIVTQDFLEFGQVTVLVSNRNSAHAFDFSQLCILGRELDG